MVLTSIISLFPYQGATENMNFIIQDADESHMELENYIIKDLIIRSYGIHDYIILSMDKMILLYEKGSLPTEKFIPIGSLNFVSKWMELKTGRKGNQIPIEIPPFLQTEYFLKRNYRIISDDEIPNKGKYFLKDVSVLKSYTYAGEMSFVDQKFLCKDHLFLLSEYVNILSEYRVYVVDGNIENICNYNGECSIFPDSLVINDVIVEMKKHSEMPKSYTIDIMVTDRGTSVVEIHNFVSVGLYGCLWSQKLLSAYQDGIDYLLSGGYR